MGEMVFQVSMIVLQLIVMCAVISLSRVKRKITLDMAIVLLCTILIMALTIKGM